MAEATVAHVLDAMRRAAEAHSAHDEHARSTAITMHRETVAQLVEAAKAQVKDAPKHGR